MTSKTQKIIYFSFIIISLLFAGVVKAQESNLKQDALSVNIKYTFESGSFEFERMTQRLVDFSNLLGKVTGTYELILFNNNSGKLETKSFFDLPKNGEMEAIGTSDVGETTGGTVTLPASDLLIVLPLNNDLKIEDLTLKINSGGKLVYEKKMSEIPFEVTSLDKYRIIEPKIELPNPTPFEYELLSKENLFSKYLWYIVAGIALIVLLGLITGLFIWRRNKNNQLISPQILPQETIIESSSSETNSQENK